MTVLAVLGSWALSLVAAYHWQAYGRSWAMLAAFAAGTAAVYACCRSIQRALSWAGIPILLMLLTFNYFSKIFLIIRADSAVGRAAGSKPAVESLVRALDSDDVFVRWGAVHKLAQRGPEASIAAEAAGRTALWAQGQQPSRQQEYLRRDSVVFLSSLGEAGKPALKTLAREGDERLRGDALYALGISEEDWKRSEGR